MRILALLSLVLVGTALCEQEHHEHHCVFEEDNSHGQQWRRCHAEERAEQISRGVLQQEEHPQDVSKVLLIRGGTVVNHDRAFQADVLVSKGKIERVARNIEAPEGAQIIEAHGKYVMPGGIDPHTHLDMQFMGHYTADDFFSGQAAALAGGTTMHIDFALPLNHDLLAGYRQWRAKAERSCMDYGFHMAITSWSDKISEDMGRLVEEEGINSFKFFLAYKGALMVNDEELAAGIARCRDLGALPMVHAENGHLVEIGQKMIIGMNITGPEGHSLSRPACVEAEATSRAIRTAEFLHAPLYVVHVMSRDAMEEIQRGRTRGLRVFGEPVISGLAKDENELKNTNFDIAAAHVMSPPIRNLLHDGLALRKALSRGVLQLVATDHAPFLSKIKAIGKNDFRKIPNGVHGLEERMHIVWETMVNSGAISVSEFVKITSTAAAQIFNIYPQKGAILEGSDADIVIFDPNRNHTISAKTHHSRVDINIYEGFEIHGYVETTISQGQIVWQDGNLQVRAGVGRYLKLKPFGPVFDGLRIEHNLKAQSLKPVLRD